MPKQTPLSKLKEMAHREHYECEDGFYACPKSESYYSVSETPKTECDCGADEHNAEVEKVFEEILVCMASDLVSMVSGKRSAEILSKTEKKVVAGFLDGKSHLEIAKELSEESGRSFTVHSVDNAFLRVRRKLRDK